MQEVVSDWLLKASTICWPEEGGLGRKEEAQLSSKNPEDGYLGEGLGVSCDWK